MKHLNSKYYLPHNVYLTIYEEIAVFLDLVNDRYITLNATETINLITLLSTEHRYLHSSALNILEQRKNNANFIGNISKNQKVADQLIKNGLLTTDSTKGREAVPTKISIPPLDLSGYDLAKKPKINIIDVVKFFYACCIAFLKIRIIPIDKIVNSIRKRKKKNKSYLSRDPNRVRDLVEVFKVLRPILFTAHNHCLFDSLALIEFMALYTAYPTWVFGVKMGPFAAHCWVQDNNFVLNEELDIAHSFSTVMAV